MSAGDRVSYADQGLSDEVVKLYFRGRRVTGWAVNSVLLALLACVIGVAWALLSHFALPVTELKNIDVPASLLSRFSNSNDVLMISGSGDLPFESWFSGLFSSFQGPVAFTFSVLGMIVCGTAIIFCGIDGLPGVFIRLGLGVSLMIASANFLGAMSDNSPLNEKTPTSSRAEFAQAVKDKDLGLVQRKLYSLSPLANDSAVNYVLAQVDLLKKPQGADQNNYKRVSKAIDANPGFTPDEKVAYLIDEAAFDEPRTEMARNYRDESLATAASRSFVAKTSFALAGLFVLIAVGFGWLARIMIKRVNRIDSDLAHKILDQEKKRPEPATD